MATIKEIKNRIKSIDSTQKITNAMYLVSSAKFNATHSALKSFGEYYEAVEAHTASVLNGIYSGAGVYTDAHRDGVRAYLVIGSEKGLAGDYNKQIAKKAELVFSENSGCVIYAVGAKIKALLKRDGIKYDEGFEFDFKSPDDESAQYLADFFNKLYLSGKISSFSVIYTDFKNGFLHTVNVNDVLPIITKKTTDDTECEFIPSKEEIAESIVPIYLKTVVRGVLLNAFCSEQNTRMLAMKSANDSAKDLLGELKLQYNHTRQNAITREITEISGERSQS